jgi:hypothetical protein
MTVAAVMHDICKEAEIVLMPRPKTRLTKSSRNASLVVTLES